MKDDLDERTRDLDQLLSWSDYNPVDTEYDVVLSSTRSALLLDNLVRRYCYETKKNES